MSSPLTNEKRAAIGVARTQLADNLRLIFEDRGLSPAMVSRLSGIAQRTIHDMLLAAHDPGVGKVDAVATALGLQAWQLLHSVTDARIAEITAIYVAANAQGKAVIDFAVDAALRMNSNGSHRRRKTDHLSVPERFAERSGDSAAIGYRRSTKG